MFVINRKNRSFRKGGLQTKKQRRGLFHDRCGKERGKGKETVKIDRMIIR